MVLLVALLPHLSSVVLYFERKDEMRWTRVPLKMADFISISRKNILVFSSAVLLLGQLGHDCGLDGRQPSLMTDPNSSQASNRP